jgi:hypothetical protein
MKPEDFVDVDDFDAIEKGTHPEFVSCDHCNGYGSSLKEEADRCTKCGGRGYIDRDKVEDKPKPSTGHYSEICDRCGNGMGSWSMSYFNTEHICDRCQELERKHPLYEEAKRTETEECKKGNYSFEGIGLPEDLRIKSRGL